MNPEASFQLVLYVTIWDNRVSDSEYDIFTNVIYSYVYICCLHVMKSKN